MHISIRTNHMQLYYLKQECNYLTYFHEILTQKTCKWFVTESQTASSFLQLLTNALHDQHQI